MEYQSKHDARDRPTEQGQPFSFWRSRSGKYLIVGAALGGLLLAYDKRPQLLSVDWLLWLPLLICVGMHFFMHGGHGHGRRGPEDRDR